MFDLCSILVYSRTNTDREKANVLKSIYYLGYMHKSTGVQYGFSKAVYHFFCFKKTLHDQWEDASRVIRFSMEV